MHFDQFGGETDCTPAILLIVLYDFTKWVFSYEYPVRVSLAGTHRTQITHCIKHSNKSKSSMPSATIPSCVEFSLNSIMLLVWKLVGVREAPFISKVECGWVTKSHNHTLHCIELWILWCYAFIRREMCWTPSVVQQTLHRTNAISREQCPFRFGVWFSNSLIFTYDNVRSSYGTNVIG